MLYPIRASMANMFKRKTLVNWNCFSRASERLRVFKLLWLLLHNVVWRRYLFQDLFPLEFRKSNFNVPYQCKIYSRNKYGNAFNSQTCNKRGEQKHKQHDQTQHCICQNSYATIDWNLESSLAPLKSLRYTRRWIDLHEFGKKGITKFYDEYDFHGINFELHEIMLIFERNVPWLVVITLLFYWFKAVVTTS